MVRTISLPSLNRRDKSTPRQRGGVLATARSILMSGRGGHGRPSSSSIRQPTTVDSNASNPLLPERRLQHNSEHQRIAALESLRQELESSRLRAAETVNSPSNLPSDGSSGKEDMSPPLTQPPDVFAPPSLLPPPPTTDDSSDYTPPELVLED
jgi:hypothetical protein